MIPWKMESMDNTEELNLISHAKNREEECKIRKQTNSQEQRGTKVWKEKNIIDKKTLTYNV